MAVDINLLEISFNVDDSILAYDAPYDRLRTWSEGGKIGRMFIYFVGLILASYERSILQKDDVLRKKFSSTEAVLAEMHTIRCIEHTGKMKFITPVVGSQVAWNENMHMEKCFHRGTMPLSLRMNKKSGKPTGIRNKNVNLVTRTQKWRGSVGCFGQIENIKRQFLI